MVCPETCVVPENKIEQDENAAMTSSRSKRKTPTTTSACALPFAKFAMPLTAALTADLPLSATCSTPDRAADALPDAALLLPAACAAVPPDGAVA